MPVILHYTASQYREKIDQLQGYYDQLNSHKGTLQDLKSRISSFWEGDGSSEAAQALQIEINYVEATMENTHEMIEFYRHSVEQLDASFDKAVQGIEAALAMLGLGG